MKSEPLIQVKNVSIVYGGRTILENINFDINAGEIFVIVGGSGCGKSSLMRQIIGLETPYTGDVFIDNKNFTNSYGKERLKILRKFGILFQSSGLFASMTVGENIALPLKTYTDLSDIRIEELVEIKLNAVGLLGFDNYMPSELSGGMKKRAALARAMALDPDILCFDEPSSGLDPITSASLDKLILDINKALGTTMVVVTHDLSSIMDISHRLIMLDSQSKGIIAEGNPYDLKNEINNEIVYNFFNRIG